MKKFLTHASILLITILIIINGRQSIEYAKSALNICYDVIIPSLFPFFICSGLLIYSGFCESIAKLCRPIMMPLFNINGSGAAAFVLGILSGYPLGAVTTCQLYENRYLSKSEAERLLAFCNNSGPLFILGSVGISLYASPRLGLLLYLAHILSSLSVGIIFRFYKRRDYHALSAPVSNPDRSFGEIFSIVIKNSVQSILMVCGTILFFSVAANLIMQYVSASAPIRSFLMGMMEFVTGTIGISKTLLALPQKLVLSSVIVGFAGLSVHMQVMGVVAGHDLSLKPYIAGKAIHGILAGVYMFVIYQLVRPAVSVFGNTASALDINGGFAVSSAYVIFTVFSLTVIVIAVFFWKILRQARHLRREFLHIHRS